MRLLHNREAGGLVRSTLIVAMTAQRSVIERMSSVSGLLRVWCINRVVSGCTFYQF